MLRIIQNMSSASAKSYYSKASDYYSEGQELSGMWGGKGAAMLGLTGEVKQNHFDALCDNLHPESGKRLTPRTKTERTVGYDFNFHVPKGVSLAYALGEDERILDAFRESVDETMREMEVEMKTRVRGQGRDTERTTGNLAWASFIHKTARPVNGIPDPHLHSHCFVFNQTFDFEEDRWKAGFFRDLKRDSPYFQAVFHSKFAKRLQELGYPIARKGRKWDLAEISKPLADKFSRRTEQVERFAAEKDIDDPAKKSEVGARTREKKQNELSLPDLRELWRERLTDDESATIKSLSERKGRPVPVRCGPEAERRAVAHAVRHCFERNSVVPVRTLLTEAMNYGVGEVDADRVSEHLHDAGVIVRSWGGRDLATTKEVIAEERSMLEFARQGRGTVKPLNAKWKIKLAKLNEGQRGAVRLVTEGRDRVMMIKGKAGTGKTALMQEAVEAIEAGGHSVFTFAPSAQASRGVLRDDGFANATTVAELLVDERLQAKAQKQVLWIDEAGLLGSRTLKRVFDVAERIDARVILSGDWKQHSSPERGEAMRLLEQEGGLKPAVVTNIERQKERRYKEVVELLADGQTAAGFAKLDELGWIREAGDGEREQLVAREYAAAIAKEQGVLVVSPTHAEAERCTLAIRQELKARKLLGSDEHAIERLIPRNLTEAERADPAMVDKGDVIVFTQNAPGHVKGSRVNIDETLPPELAKLASRFQVFRRSELKIAKGDAIRITAIGKTKDGKHRLNNGAIYKVAGFTDQGDIRLNNKWVVGADFGFMAPGYVVTSHASQGRTVDKVILLESQTSYPAASPEQFYVSVSRGRKQALVVTDSKTALLDAIGCSQPRLAATELLNHFDERTQQIIRELTTARTEIQEPKRERELTYAR